MNEFDRRWHDCVAAARQEAAAAQQAPVGFAARAWAKWTARANASLASAWTVLSFRALLAATIVLVVLAVTELRRTPAGSPLAPHLEDVVTNVWKSL